MNKNSHKQKHLRLAHGKNRAWSFLAMAWVLTACNKNAPPDSLEQSAAPSVQQSAVNHSPLSLDKNLPMVIDWQKLHTPIVPSDPQNYPYPFARDSDPVQKYAAAFAVTPAQAQHSMMLAMAAPEALNKVLDQIPGHYLGHHLTDGAAMRLLIYTDDGVQAGTYDYVFAGEFGQGLVLPIEIVPKSTKLTSKERLHERK